MPREMLFDVLEGVLDGPSPGVLLDRKYRSERYAPSKRWFPGTEYVDGAIEGAMKAGMQAYS